MNLADATRPTVVETRTGGHFLATCKLPLATTPDGSEIHYYGGLVVDEAGLPVTEEGPFIQRPYGGSYVQVGQAVTAVYYEGCRHLTRMSPVRQATMNGTGLTLIGMPIQLIEIVEIVEGVLRRDWPEGGPTNMSPEELAGWVVSNLLWALHACYMIDFLRLDSQVRQAYTNSIGEIGSPLDRLTPFAEEKGFMPAWEGYLAHIGQGSTHLLLGCLEKLVVQRLQPVINEFNKFPT